MPFTPFTISLMVLSLLLGSGLGVGGYQYYVLSRDFGHTQAELASTTDRYYSLEQTATELQTALEAEQAKNGTFASQITTITTTVGTLDKLAKTDKELLAKYSRVYFLSEHYTPKELTTLSNELGYPPEKPLQINARVSPYIDALMTAAKADGVDLRITSAYRSFASQKSLKTSYSVLYGKGANAFSADQGYSEHQLGTTVDFTTASSNGALVGFEKTKAHEWLLTHAHTYGFVLSYPKGNAYYQYEPWHWRYVGTALATRLYQDKDYFYELDQREIDTYLVSLFD